MLSLCQILANEQNDDQIRMSAGLAMKNTLTAKVSVSLFGVERERERGISSRDGIFNPFLLQEFARKEELTQRWLLTAEDLRVQIKQGVS